MKKTLLGSVALVIATTQMSSGMTGEEFGMSSRAATSKHYLEPTDRFDQSMQPEPTNQWTRGTNKRTRRGAQILTRKKTTGEYQLVGQEFGEQASARTAELMEPAATGELMEPAATGELMEPAATGELMEPAATGELMEPAATGELMEPAATADQSAQGDAPGVVETRSRAEPAQSAQAESSGRQRARGGAIPMIIPDRKEAAVQVRGAQERDMTSPLASPRIAFRSETEDSFGGSTRSSIPNERSSYKSQLVELADAIAVLLGRTDGLIGSADMTEDRFRSQWDFNDKLQADITRLTEELEQLRCYTREQARSLEQLAGGGIYAAQRTGTRMTPEPARHVPQLHPSNQNKLIPDAPAQEFRGDIQTTAHMPYQSPVAKLAGLFARPFHYLSRQATQTPERESTPKTDTPWSVYGAQSGLFNPQQPPAIMTPTAGHSDRGEEQEFDTSAASDKSQEMVLDPDGPQTQQVISEEWSE